MVRSGRGRATDGGHDMTTIHDAGRRLPTAGLRGLIARHPLVAFASLAIAGSWIAWLPYIMSAHGLGLWDIDFPVILGSAQLSGVLPGAYLGPIAAAFLVTAVTEGRPGLRRWAARLWRWRVGGRWYALALVGVPAVVLASGAAFSGGDVHAPSLLALAVYVPALVLQMVTTGLAEEPGWRDFALPRLQRRFGPLAASLVLGPLWALWHMPLFLSDWGGWPDAQWTRPLFFAGFCVAFTIVITWVFNRARESLPLIVLLHVGVNTTSSVLWPEMFPTIDGETSMLALMTTATIAAVALIAATRGRLGLPPVASEAPAPEPAVTRLVHSDDGRR
jgi:membrane protease YdiL (CAAX protease family)